MLSALDSIREVIGSPAFYILGSDGVYWDYGALIEYFFAGTLLIVVVASVFRLLGKLFD